MPDLATAVLAWVEHDVPEPPALCLICHLERTEISATLCTARSGLVSVIDTDAARPPADVDERLAKTDAHRPGVLRTAVSSERFRDAPVYKDAGGWVPAGELIDAFAPYGALAARTAGQLLGRHPDLEPLDLGYVLVGELAAFPLAADVLATAIPPGSRLLTSGPPQADILQLGAELITSGAIRLPDTYPYAVAMRTSEIRGGRIVNRRMILAPAHTLDSSGDAVFGEPPQHPTPVTVDTCNAGAIELDLLAGADDIHPLDRRPIDPPEPGNYAVGVRLVHGCAELVFSPEGDGAPETRAVGPLPAMRAS